MIRIANRLRPFSHLPGSCCLIPGTSYEVEIFPSLIRFYDLGKGKRELIDEIVVEAEGPLKEFTVMQDLERGCVSVWGEGLSYHVLPTLEIVETKNPKVEKPASHEKLSLGSHKKQEWEMVKKRCDFREIFPLWFRLGSLTVPGGPLKGKKGIFSLLEECKEKIDTHRPERILCSFERLFLAGFRSMMVPRLVDEDYLGILPVECEPGSETPLHLLSEGARLIRSLFITQKKNKIAILPNLPPEFFAGRMIQLNCDAGEVDLEWTKKCVRQMVFRAKKDGEVCFDFPSSVNRFRVRVHPKEKGEVLLCGKPLEIKSGTTYLLDRFL